MTISEDSTHIFLTDVHCSVH